MKTNTAIGAVGAVAIACAVADMIIWAAAGGVGPVAAGAVLDACACALAASVVFG